MTVTMNKATSPDKVVSILGFAIKAGKVLYGCDSIERYHKRKYLMILCGTLSDNSRDKIIRSQVGVPTVVVKQTTVEEMTHHSGCKAIAVIDKQMAQAMLDNMNGTYQRVTEVNHLG